MAIDPVCGVAVKENEPPAQSDYRGQTYFFHSFECKVIFDANPPEYVTAANKPPRH